MRKHTFSMVFLLIVALSLIGAVAAGDNVTYSDDAPILDCSVENQIDSTTNLELPEDTSDSEGFELISQCGETHESAVEAHEVDARMSDSNYELGYEITEDFTGLVKIDNYDDVLVITNAGYLKINNQTTENVLNGINDASNGYITYEDGNLVILSSTADSVNVAFLYKNNETLTVAFYNDYNTQFNYDEIGPEISAGLLEKMGLNHEDANSYLAIINSWTNGRLDDLNLRTYKRYVPFGLSGGNDKLQTVKYYPHEFDLPLADALGVSRDFDDDAFTLKKSNSSDELASVAVSMVGKSMEESSSLDLYDIGVNACNKALNYFKSKGVDIPKDYPYLYVLTSVGHVKVDGLKTDEVLDGILDGLGPKFNKKHLISVDDPSWKDLVFYFIVVKNTKQISYALKYDSATGKLVESSEVKKQGDNMAKDRGLYSTHSKRYKSSKTVSHRIISYSTAKDVNQTLKSVNVTGSRNSTENVSNISNNTVNKPDVKDVEMPKGHNGNPFNIVYNLVAILMVCVIFGVGYRKR